MNNYFLDKKTICKKLFDMSMTSFTLPVFLCIGSDRITGDCFGPLVGQALATKHNIVSHVYGTLTHPVTALNLVETLDFIKHQHSDCEIIAVDSSLGKQDEIGQFRIIADGIYPGLGVGKRLPKVGDYSITATVAPYGDKSIYGVRLGPIYAQAIFIADCIEIFICEKLKNLKPLKTAN